MDLSQSLREEPTARPASVGWLTVHYVFTVTCVVLLCFLDHYLVHRDLSLQVDELRRLEASQHQVMLSHKLNRVVESPKVTGVDYLARLLEDGQIALTVGDPGHQLPECPDPVAKTLLDSARSHLSEALSAARNLSADPASTSWGMFETEITQYRAAMEQVMVYLNHQAQVRLNQLQVAELSLFCLILLVLAAEGLLVFRPAIVSLRNLIADLESRRHRLTTRLQALRSSHEQIKADLQAAAAVQRSLLPQEGPQVPGVEVSWCFRASHDVAGDMFNVIRLDETHLGLYVLDVSGHGVPAALLSVSLSRTINANLGELLKRRVPGPAHYRLVPPAEVARELNRRFPVSGESEQFFTFLYGILDTTTRNFTWVQAGHPGPVLMSDRSTRTWETPQDPPIGILDEVAFHEETLTLEEGELLFLYTDGVAEARDSQGQEFGTHRMMSVMRGHWTRGVGPCIEAVDEDLRSFTQGLPQRDDITLLGFGIVPPVSS